MYATPMPEEHLYAEWKQRLAEGNDSLQTSSDEEEVEEVAPAPPEPNQPVRI